MFERFYRISEATDKEIDEAEKKPVTGSGLGLAIVQNIAQRHHAKIKLSDSSYASGLAVTVIFSGVDE